MNITFKDHLQSAITKLDIEEKNKRKLEIPRHELLKQMEAIGNLNKLSIKKQSM